MTPSPSPQQQPTWPAGAWPLRRILFLAAFVLFVIGAFAAGGDVLGGIPALTWISAAFGAWVLSGAVP